MAAGNYTARIEQDRSDETFGQLIRPLQHLGATLEQTAKARAEMDLLISSRRMPKLPPLRFLAGQTLSTTGTDRLAPDDKS